MLKNSAAQHVSSSTSHAERPATREDKPLTIYETSRMSPDLLIAMSKDFGRPEVCAARSVFHKAKEEVAVEPTKRVNGTDRIVLRFPRYAMRRIAAAMEQQDPAVGQSVRQAVNHPEAYAAPKPTR